MGKILNPRLSKTINDGDCSATSDRPDIFLEIDTLTKILSKNNGVL